MQVYHMPEKKFVDLPLEENLPHHLIIFEGWEEFEEIDAKGINLWNWVVFDEYNIGTKKIVLVKSSELPNEFMFNTDGLTAEQKIEKFLDKLETKLKGK